MECNSGSLLRVISNTSFKHVLLGKMAWSSYFKGGLVHQFKQDMVIDLRGVL